MCDRFELSDQYNGNFFSKKTLIRFCRLYNIDKWLEGCMYNSKNNLLYLPFFEMIVSDFYLGYTQISILAPSFTHAFFKHVIIGAFFNKSEFPTVICIDFEQCIFPQHSIYNYICKRLVHCVCNKCVKRLKQIFTDFEFGTFGVSIYSFNKLVLIIYCGHIFECYITGNAS